MTGKLQTAGSNALMRLKPDPIPLLHPVPEYLATGTRKAVYDETKRVLQVPWMGVVTMAMAHYPAFYGTLWEGLRPLYESVEFVAACRRLREAAEDVASSLSVTPLQPQLAELGYAAREIEQIRELIEVFSHGNMPYLLIATQARLLLEGHSLSAETSVQPGANRHGAAATVPLVLMEKHHVDAPTRELYSDITSRLGLPFVNTDYRALARWPTYFSAAWAGLREQVGGEAYERITEEVHRTAVDTVLALPNPGRLVPEQLRAAAGAQFNEILNMVRLFQWLLPGLIVNVAFFRAQLSED
ncbi:hypothetical protein [Azoarcus sp. DN11]|uniref:hypothetical protein n=1 Tax=Azoarcus sp. DN11 TaxID=356837 RepID=UPI000EAC460C|nr:hypothetical protein [Azoarcus sp. DN11]AYH43861.1 hypothetical protein CDA09_10745 [Azoarcus sp. DN11]